MGAGEAGRRYPAYSRLVDELGIHENVKAMEALAELISYLDLTNSPLRGLRKLLGLYKLGGGNTGVYTTEDCIKHIIAGDFPADSRI